MQAKAAVSVGYEFLVSNELVKRKDSETMWQHIKYSLDDNKKFIYVGGNPVTDAKINVISACKTSIF